MAEIQESIVPNLSAEPARYMRWLLTYARLLKQDNDELQQPQCGKCVSYRGVCKQPKAQRGGEVVDPGTKGCMYFD
jgi:hypothetical protein